MCLHNCTLQNVMRAVCIRCTVPQHDAAYAMLAVYQGRLCKHRLAWMSRVQPSYETWQEGEGGCAQSRFPGWQVRELLGCIPNMALKWTTAQDITWLQTLILVSAVQEDAWVHASVTASAVQADAWLHASVMASAGQADVWPHT